MNKNAICRLGIVPVRKQPSDSSELVTQLLYGEQCYILEVAGSWLLTELMNDGYRGYIDMKQIEPVPTGHHSEYLVREPLIRLNGRYLPMGSELSPGELPDKAGGQLESSGAIVNKGLRTDRHAIIATARDLLDSPYLWGGRSALGIDCSGFTQVVLKVNGFALPRDSGDQSLEGTGVQLDDARSGDLAFFSKPGKTNVSHVGFIIKEENGTQVIHASGRVRIDRMTREGILHPELGHTHQLTGIRDVVSGQ